MTTLGMWDWEREGWEGGWDGGWEKGVVEMMACWGGAGWEETGGGSGIIIIWAPCISDGAPWNCEVTADCILIIRSLGFCSVTATKADWVTVGYLIGYKVTELSSLGAKSNLVTKGLVLL